MAGPLKYRGSNSKMWISTFHTHSYKPIKEVLYKMSWKKIFLQKQNCKKTPKKESRIGTLNSFKIEIDSYTFWIVCLRPQNERKEGQTKKRPRLWKRSPKMIFRFFDLLHHPAVRFSLNGCIICSSLEERLNNSIVMY